MSDSSSFKDATENLHDHTIGSITPTPPERPTVKRVTSENTAATALPTVLANPEANGHDSTNQRDAAEMYDMDVHRLFNHVSEETLRRSMCNYATLTSEMFEADDEPTKRVDNDGATERVIIKCAYDDKKTWSFESEQNLQLLCHIKYNRVYGGLYGMSGNNYEMYSYLMYDSRSVDYVVRRTKVTDMYNTIRRKLVTMLNGDRRGQSQITGTIYTDAEHAVRNERIQYDAVKRISTLIVGYDPLTRSTYNVEQRELLHYNHTNPTDATLELSVAVSRQHIMIVDVPLSCANDNMVDQLYKVIKNIIDDAQYNRLRPHTIAYGYEITRAMEWCNAGYDRSRALIPAIVHCMMASTRKLASIVSRPPAKRVYNLVNRAEYEEMKEVALAKSYTSKYERRLYMPFHFAYRDTDIITMVLPTKYLFDIDPNSAIKLLNCVINHQIGLTLRSDVQNFVLLTRKLACPLVDYRLSAEEAVLTTYVGYVNGIVLAHDLVQDIGRYEYSAVMLQQCIVKSTPCMMTLHVDYVIQTLESSVRLYIAHMSTADDLRSCHIKWPTISTITILDRKKRTNESVPVAIVSRPNWYLMSGRRCVSSALIMPLKIISGKRHKRAISYIASFERDGKPLHAMQTIITRPPIKSTTVCAAAMLPDIHEISGGRTTLMVETRTNQGLSDIDGIADTETANVNAAGEHKEDEWTTVDIVVAFYSPHLTMYFRSNDDFKRLCKVPCKTENLIIPINMMGDYTFETETVTDSSQIILDAKESDIIDNKISHESPYDVKVPKRTGTVALAQANDKPESMFLTHEEMQSLSQSSDEESTTSEGSDSTGYSSENSSDESDLDSVVQRRADRARWTLGAGAKKETQTVESTSIKAGKDIAADEACVVDKHNDDYRQRMFEEAVEAEIDLVAKRLKPLKKTNIDDYIDAISDLLKKAEQKAAVLVAKSVAKNEGPRIKGNRYMEPRDIKKKCSRWESLETAMTSANIANKSKASVELALKKAIVCEEITAHLPVKYDIDISPYVAAAIHDDLSYEELAKLLNYMSDTKLAKDEVVLWLDRRFEAQVVETTLTRNYNAKIPYVDMTRIMLNEIKIGSDTYTGSAPISTMEVTRLASGINCGNWIRALYKSYDMVVLDYQNMKKHMGLNDKAINDLCELLDVFGVTTLNVVESGASGITNATYNVLAEPDEHDDIIELTFANCHRAVIVTNDNHKEFNDHLSYCAAHKQLLVRKNEKCFTDDPQRCNIHILRTNKVAYSSFNNIESDGVTTKLTMHKPLIRYKGQKKTGTTSETIKLNMRSTKINRWSCNITPTGMPVVIKNVINSAETTSYSVATYGYSNKVSSILSVNKYAAIAHLINTLPPSEINQIVSTCCTEVVISTKGLVIRKTSGENTLIEPSNDEMNFRGNRRQLLSSPIYGMNASVTHGVIKNDMYMKDYKETTLAENSQFLLISRLTNKSACILFNRGKAYVTLVSGALQERLQLAAMQTLIYDSTKVISGMPLTDESRGHVYQVVTSRAISQSVEEDRIMSRPLINRRNVLWQLNCKAPIKGVVGNIDDADPTEVAHFAKLVPKNCPAKRVIVRTSNRVAEKDVVTSATAAYLKQQCTAVHSSTGRINITLVGADDLKVLITGFNEHDFATIREDIEYYVKVDYKAVIIDAATIFRNMVATGELMFLPPLLRAHKLPNLKVMAGEEPVAVNITWILAGCAVVSDVYIGKDATTSFITNFMSPAPTMLFSTVALMHNRPNMSTYEHDEQLMDDLQMQFMITCLEGFFDVAQESLAYYTAFSIPLRLCGIDPYVAMHRYQPVIRNNIVCDMVINKNNIFEMDESGYQVSLTTFIDDIVNNCGASGLLRIREGVMINVSAEVHELIDKFGTMTYAGGLFNIKHVMKYLRCIIKMDDIFEHLSSCYGIMMSADTNEDEFATHLYSLVMAKKVKPCECKIQMKDLSLTRKMLSIKANLFPHPNDPFVDNTFVAFENQSIQMKPYVRVPMFVYSDSLPVSGSICLLILKCKRRSKYPFSRCQPILDYITENKSILQSTKVINVENDFSDIQRLEQMIYQLSETNADIVILNDDQFPSLFRKHVSDYIFRFKDGTNVIVPDSLMLVTMNAHWKQNIIMVNEDTKRSPAQPTQQTSSNDGTSNQQDGSDKNDYTWILVIGALVLFLVLVLAYYFWPYVATFLLFPWKMVLKLLGSKAATASQTGWFGWVRKVTPLAKATVPLWKKLVAGVATASWWAALCATFSFGAGKSTSKR